MYSIPTSVALGWGDDGCSSECWAVVGCSTSVDKCCRPISGSKMNSCSMHNSHVLRTSVTFFLNPFRRLRSSCLLCFNLFLRGITLYSLWVQQTLYQILILNGLYSACLKYLGKWLPKCIFSAHILCLNPGNKLGLTPVQGIDPCSGKNGKPQNSCGTLGCNSTQVYTCNVISGTHACTHSLPKHTCLPKTQKKKIGSFGHTLVVDLSNGTKGEPQNSACVAPEVQQHTGIAIIRDDWISAQACFM